MKTITKIALIGGLLASSIALAAPNPDTDPRKPEGCHHGAHSKMMKDEGKFPGSDGGSVSNLLPTAFIGSSGFTKIETPNERI